MREDTELGDRVESNLFSLPRIPKRPDEKKPPSWPAVYALIGAAKIGDAYCATVNFFKDIYYGIREYAERKSPPIL